MKKYLIKKLKKSDYDRIAILQDIESNLKLIVSFIEYENDNRVKERDIIEGKLFIQYVCKSFKTNKELKLIQPLEESPHVEGILKVLKIISTDSLVAKYPFFNIEILIEFEDDVTYKKNDIIFVEGELSIELE